MCRSSSFPLQVSVTPDLRFARDPGRRLPVIPTGYLCGPRAHIRRHYPESVSRRNTCGVRTTPR